MKITIAVASYNSASTIGACVESLVKTDYPNKEIIIVDDGSTDNTLKILENYPVKIIRQNHAGVSAGRDNAFRNATGNIIAYTDSDCEVDKYWLKELIKPFNDPTVGATTGHTIFRTDHRCTSWLRSLDIEERYEKRKMYTGLANGTNCAFRKSILQEIGGFNPEWFHAEDTEVSYRILKKGYKIYYQPSAIVHHVPEGDWKSYLRKRYRGTKAHLRIMPKFTKDVMADDFVSPKMIIQPLLYTSFLTCLVFSIFIAILSLFQIPHTNEYSKILVIISILLLLFGFIFDIPLINNVIRKSKKPGYLIKSILLLSAKSLAISLGVYAGVIQYRLLKQMNKK